MTTKQENLIRYIYNYRRTNQVSPTFKEMVGFIGVHDNRSLLSTMKRLFAEGYLEKNRVLKQRNINLTNKGRKFIQTPKTHFLDYRTEVKVDFFSRYFDLEKYSSGTHC